MQQESAHHFLSQNEKDDRSRSTRIPASDRQKEIYSTMAMRYPRDVLQVWLQLSIHSRLDGSNKQTQKFKSTSEIHIIFFSKQLHSKDSSTAMYTKCLHENSIHTISLVPTVIRFWFCLAFGNIASQPVSSPS